MVAIETKHVGFLLVAIGLIMLVTIFYFVDALAKFSEDSCECGDTCDMTHFVIPPIVYLAVTGVLALLVMGVYLVFSTPNTKPQTNIFWKNKANNLEADDKTIYELILKEGGTTFQADLVKKLDWSKAKVTRTLDRLESRQLLERKRRGLTNIVVLKSD